MSWQDAFDVAAAVCLLTGSTLALIAAIGITRFPDLLTRIHAASKPQVLGLLLVVLGLALRLRDPAVTGLLVVIAVAQLLTAPVASHMIARASFRAREVRTDLLVVDELSGRELDEPRGAP